jgi:hypothetical protein
LIFSCADETPQSIHEFFEAALGVKRLSDHARKSITGAAEMRQLRDFSTDESDPRGEAGSSLGWDGPGAGRA